MAREVCDQDLEEEAFRGGSSSLTDARGHIRKGFKGWEVNVLIFIFG